MIKKELFCEVIETIRQQMIKDRNIGLSIAEAFNIKVHCAYNNSLLIRLLIKMLNEHFPPDEDGFCAIEFYCFHCEFGSLDEEIMTPEELYEKLTKK